MSKSIRATATVQSWEESPYDESEGTATTSRARITYRYEGDLVGESVAELLMVYVAEEAEYVGLERVTASIDGKPGAFVVSSVGSFRGGVARSTWNVIAGSATGELGGLSGAGDAEAPKGKQLFVNAEITLA